MSMFGADGKFAGPKCDMERVMHMSKEECAAYCDSMKCSSDEKVMCMEHAGKASAKSCCKEHGAETKTCGGGH